MFEHLTDTKRGFQLTFESAHKSAQQQKHYAFYSHNLTVMEKIGVLIFLGRKSESDNFFLFYSNIVPL